MITKNHVVSLDYCIKDDDENVLESSKEGLLTYIHGYGKLPIRLESELEGKSQGATISLRLKPEDCFGQRDEGLVKIVGPEMFAEGQEVKAGLIFQNMTEHGSQLIHVTKVDGDEITIDANHPFAGKFLTWDVIVLSYRTATNYEITQGSADAMYAPGNSCCEGKSSCSIHNKNNI